MAEKDLRTGDYRDTSGRSLLERDFGGEGEAYRLAYPKGGQAAIASEPLGAL
jgi:hypothetical protein